jgi:Flp pilus assembly protein TadD
MRALRIMPMAAIVAFSVAGCAYSGIDGASMAGPSGEVIVYPVLQPGPEQDLVERAKAHFIHGEYGLAELNYRQAVERYKDNVEAWLGLAASYDHLKRFEEADRVYDVLQRRIGNTPALLNNLGYHYILKGEFGSAEHALLTAQSRDPDNLCIRANLALLADWKAAAGRAG